MSLVEFAKKELAKLPSDNVQQHMNVDIMRVITFFEEVANDHSGYSASYLLSMFTHLAERKEIRVGISDQEAYMEEFKEHLTKALKYHKRMVLTGYKEGMQARGVIEKFKDTAESIWLHREDEEDVMIKL